MITECKGGTRIVRKQGLLSVKANRKKQTKEELVVNL